MRITVFRCDWCGRRMQKPSAEMVIISNHRSHYDICDKCNKEIIERVSRTRKEDEGVV